MNNDDPMKISGGIDQLGARATQAAQTAAQTIEKQGQVVAARAADVMENLEKKGQAVASRAAEAWDATKAKAEDALQSSERYVRDHPAPSLFGVFTAGILIGALVGWRAAHEERDDYSTCARDFLKRWGHKLNLD